MLFCYWLGIICWFGIPGILGDIFTSIFLGSLKHEAWKKTIIRENRVEETLKRELIDLFHYIRSPRAIGEIHVCALFITIVITICTGIITGFFFSYFEYSGKENFFIDNMIFENKNNLPEYNNTKILSS